MKRSALEMALLPTPQDGPRVSLVRGDVTSPGMVSTEPGDVVGSPVDGPAVSGSGAVLTIDGHRLFIPYGAVTAPEVVEQLEQLAGIATGTQDAVSETHTTAVDAAEQAEAAVDAVAAAADRIDAAQAAADNAATEAGQALAGLAEAIVSQQLEYAVSSSETVPPTTGWSTDSPTRTPGSYIWQRVRVFRSNGDDAVSEPVLVTGNAGPQGEKGDTGADGAPGAAGVGLESTEVTYAQTTSGTTAPTSGWTPTVPTLVKGRYLWTRSVWTYTDTSTETGYSVAYVPQDGADGDDGLPGAPGVGITNTSITYAQSTSGTTAPTSGWVAQPPSPVAGRYVWTKTVWTYSNGDTETGYSVGKIGDTGAQGAGVSNITSFFRLLPTGSPRPATPSGETPSGYWSPTEPDYVPERDLWRTERIALSDGSYTWTTPQKSSAYAAAVHVANLAEAATQGLVKVQQADPGHYPGRIWYQTDATGRGIGIKVSVNGAWVSYMLVADQLLVPSSIGSVQIANGAITGPKLHVDALDFKEGFGLELTSGILTGALIRSSASGTRIQIDRENLGGRLRYLDGAGYSRIAMEVNAGGGYLSFYDYIGGEALKISQADGLTIDSQKIVMNSSRFVGDWTGTVNLAASDFILRCKDVRLGSTGGVYGLSWKLRYAQAGTTANPVHAAIWEYQGGPSRMPPITGGFPLAMSANSSGTGTICVTTSSRRAKADIRDIGVDPYRILDVRPRDWLDRAALEADPTLTTRTPGVVAEEVEDAGLSEFVTYHNDQVQGVMYDRLPVLFIPIIKDLIKRIETLEGTRNG